MKARSGRPKSLSLLGLGAAVSTAACFSFTAPAQAAATSGVWFQANTNGLQSIMNPGGSGPFVSSTTLQCLNGSCNPSTPLGTLFQGATTYTPFSFDYTADNLQLLTSTTFTKDFTGSLGGFAILGGVNPLALVTITGPVQGIFDGTFAPTAEYPNGEVQNSTRENYQASATVTVNGTTYSSAVVLFSAYSKFGWSPQYSSVPLASASNVWIYVDETSGSSSVPSPLPLLGASATFAWARKLRKVIKTAV